MTMFELGIYFVKWCVAMNVKANEDKYLMIYLMTT